MDSTYRIVRTPQTVLSRTGHRHLLVEAVELRGGAIFRGVYVPPPSSAAGTPIILGTDEEAAVEAAFVAASPEPPEAPCRERSAGQVAHTRPRVARPGRHL
jgi:hypothetical protein